MWRWGLSRVITIASIQDHFQIVQSKSPTNAVRPYKADGLGSLYANFLVWFRLPLWWKALAFLQDIQNKKMAAIMPLR